MSHLLIQAVSTEHEVQQSVQRLASEADEGAWGTRFANDQKCRDELEASMPFHASYL